MIRYFVVAALFMLFFAIYSASTYAETTLEDIEIELGVEVGNEFIDFDDADTTIEKGRFMTYQIAVHNNGTNTHENLIVLMDTPDYMVYVPETTYVQEISSPEAFQVLDIDGVSGLEIGYEVESLSGGSSVYFLVQYQISVPETVPDDPLYTVAWASVFGQYSAIPITSEVIENTISGEAMPTIQVETLAYPEVGESVNSGFYITYSYTLHNVGGVTASDVTFTTFLPDHTYCESGCGLFNIGEIEPNFKVYITMIVLVESNLEGVSEITNIGFDCGGSNFAATQNRESIIHPIDLDAVEDEGEFIVDIIQIPDIILNSSDGSSARYDQADVTETVYTLTYDGRHRNPTYPSLSSSAQSVTSRPCGNFYHGNEFGAYFYAYNSSGGGCEDINMCPISSSPIVFNIDTVLPEAAPRLEFTTNIPTYSHGSSTSAINSYMNLGSMFTIPDFLTQSRAVENGALGFVSSTVSASVAEDRWQYVYADYDVYLCTRCYSCGLGCTYCVNYDRPVYEWKKMSSGTVNLADTDETDITVYTSTAWLKTEGGHIGTNDNFTNNADTIANYVDIGGNPVIIPSHLTPSDIYTPPGETNSEYMIFGNNGTGTFQSESGDDWKVTGTEFPFVQRGEAYDRENNSRDYYDDLLTREMYGEVIVDGLPSVLTGVVDLGDDIIWSNTGDIIIGQAGINDTVAFYGGQARIYTTGDVYINANIFYYINQAASYNEITSVRIDARNIYVSGEVTDLEVMLLARESFHSGQSKNQLRILGDVIAGQSYWEREPLLEFDPIEFNKPSEHIIEDMRKYVVPPPGDTELPDDYTIWRQVNPSTGEVLDGY